VNVGPLPGMDNPVGKYFEFPSLKGKLSVAFLIPDVLCLIVLVDRIRQNSFSTRCYVRDNSQNKTKAYVGPRSLRSK